MCGGYTRGTSLRKATCRLASPPHLILPQEISPVGNRVDCCQPSITLDWQGRWSLPSVSFAC